MMYKENSENEDLCEIEANVKKKENESQDARNLKNIFCVNCGEKGHIIKSCTGPITSFGIIAFKKVYSEKDCKYDLNSNLTHILNSLNLKQTEYPTIKFLMIQRKDTMGYIDFLRGKYDFINNEAPLKFNYIKTCMDEMTFEEKQNLLTKPWDELWDSLWVNHNSRCYKNEYELAKKKFMLLNIPALLAKSTNSYNFSEFGFPKGRRNTRESNIQCAEREFHEETGYNKNCYDFIKEYPIIEEKFVGTNNITYKHIYYLVKIKDNVPPPYVDINNKLQLGEVKNIGWFTIDECLALIRPYDNAKKKIILNTYNDIIKMNNKYNCSNRFYIKTNSYAYNLVKITELYNSKSNYLIEAPF